ncbi:two-component system response regulator [Phenylobacterium sp.]|uniref:response regulator n=1 Tax=Phenylobacterium sp. TaxID=1871053 RepID=UPI0035AF6261
MFDDDAKLIRKMAPQLQRVLIIDPQPAGARLLADLMRTLVRSQVWIAPSGRKALAMIHEVDAQIIFVELAGVDTDGVEFTRRLRRSDALCRQAPVVIMTAEATAQAIRAARDAGVSEFMRKPFTTKDLLRRLEAVTLHPRDWIEAVEYIGPDRRRFNSGDYKGPRKRKSDARQTPDAERISQALKILKSAAAAAASDPTQALRAMLAQAADLDRAARTVGDGNLANAVAVLQRYLNAVVDKTAPFTREEAERRVAPLLLFLPAETSAKAKTAAA